MRRRTRKGIFCLEGDWWGVKDRTSMEPVLRLLENNAASRVPYIRRDVGTMAEFDFYVKKWAQKGMTRYPVLYLGFHGDKGLIYVGEGRLSKTEVRLPRLGKLLEGQCQRRIIHFGSCSTLDVHGSLINRFLEQTQALAVCGYRAEADWLLSAAFETLFLGEMQEFSLTRRGMTKLSTRIKDLAPGMCRQLDFRMVVAS